MWVGFMTLEYVNDIPWAPQIKWEYSFIIHTFKVNLEIWVELYSQHYEQEVLFTPMNICKNIVHSNIIPFDYY